MFGFMIFGVVPFATPLFGDSLTAGWVDQCKGMPSWTIVERNNIDNARCTNAT
jgi:hypothetical protein